MLTFVVAAAMVLAPQASHAMSTVVEPNECYFFAGELVKIGDHPAIYQATNAGIRAFESRAVYASWYDDFSNVRSVPQYCADNQTIQLPMKFRPGSRLVKSQVSARVYTTQPGNVLVEIGSGDIAESLYGSDWGSMVSDIPDYEFATYAKSTQPLNMAIPPEAMTLRKQGDSTVYHVQYGQYVKMEGALGPAITDSISVVSEDVFNQRSVGFGTMSQETLISMYLGSTITIGPVPAPVPTPTPIPTPTPVPTPDPVMYPAEQARIAHMFSEMNEVDSLAYEVGFAFSDSSSSNSEEGVVLALAGEVNAKTCGYEKISTEFFFAYADDTDYIDVTGEARGFAHGPNGVSGYFRIDDVTVEGDIEDIEKESIDAIVDNIRGQWVGETDSTSTDELCGTDSLVDQDVEELVLEHNPLLVTKTYGKEVINGEAVDHIEFIINEDGAEDMAEEILNSGGLGEFAGTISEGIEEVSDRAAVAGTTPDHVGHLWIGQDDLPRKVTFQIDDDYMSAYTEMSFWDFNEDFAIPEPIADMTFDEFIEMLMQDLEAAAGAYAVEMRKGLDSMRALLK